MTVQTQSPNQYFSGPLSINTVLSIQNFTFVENSHVSVKIRGESTNWVYGTDYTVAGANTLNRTVTIKKAVAAGQVLAVFLDVPITQGISPEEGGNLPAATLEYTLDKLTYICQDLNARVGRAIQVSVDSNFNGIMYDTEANKGKFFVINNSGTGVTFSTYKATDLEYIANRLYASIGNVDIVADNIASVNTTATNVANVNTVAGSITNVNLTGGSIANVNTVGTDLALGQNSAINKVNANKANIDINAANITDIQNAYTNAQTCIQKASEASLSAITANTQAGNAHVWSEGTDAEVQALGGEHSAKGWASEASKGQIQSNWEETDTQAKSYIRNKPNLDNGYFPNLKVGLADNLYDASVPISIGTFNFRTTAGDESVSTGTAILNDIHGAMHIAGHVPRSGSATASTADLNLTNFNLDQFETQGLATGTYTFIYNNGTWTLNGNTVTPSNYGLTVAPRPQSLGVAVSNPELAVTCTNENTFKLKVNDVTGLYVFEYIDRTIEGQHVGPYWAYNNEQVDITEWALEVVGTPADTNTITCNFISSLKSGTITVNYVKETLGTITVATPTALKATASMNQYSGSTYIADATINSDGEIISSVGSKVCYCRAVGGIYSGYVAYSEAEAITKIAYHNAVPVMGDTLTLTGTTQDSELSVVLFNNDGYVCVAVTDDSDLTIHPRWSSGQDQDHTYDEYELSTLTLPTVDAEGTTLPWTTVGLVAIDSVYDEINLDSKKYIRRINRLTYSAENLAIVQAYGMPYKYDTNYIYYVFKGADIVTYDLAQNVAREYIANDYGTEWFIGTTLEIQTNISYGVNLKDKLRTDVVTISEQTLTQTQQNQIATNLNKSLVSTISQVLTDSQKAQVVTNLGFSKIIPIIKDVQIGYSGYTIWANGKCEQRGYVTTFSEPPGKTVVQLTKEFKQITGVFATSGGAQEDSSRYSYVTLRAIPGQALKFEVVQSSGDINKPFYWKAEGYLSVEEMSNL